jgi:hypothetical protein
MKPAAYTYLQESVGNLPKLKHNLSPGERGLTIS